LFLAGIGAFMAAVVFACISVWNMVNTMMFQTLNMCVDQDASLGWLQEQPYRPSAEYLSCVSGVHHASIIEASLVVGLLVCAVVAFVTWTVEEFFNDHVVPADGSQAYMFSFRAVYTACGVAAILLGAASVMMVFPVS
jgi:hypothetical protein